MLTEHKEIIRDLLMYLAGAVDSSRGTAFHDGFKYTRHHLKSIYDYYLSKQKLDELSITESVKDDNSIFNLFFRDSKEKRIYHCLTAEGITTIEELKQKTIRDLIRIPNLGKKSLAKIVCIMNEKFNYKFNNGFENRYIPYGLRRICNY